MNEPGIPVIDISYGGNAYENPAAIAAVSRACEDIGFFVLVGHNVPAPATERLSHLSQNFFDLPASTKYAIGETGGEFGGLSYFPWKGESLAATLGDETPPDLKESLDFGPGFRGSPWPDEPVGFRVAWLVYFDALSGLATDLRHIFAVALGLAPHYFDDKFDRHLSSLRVLNYPEQDTTPEPGQIRAGAHTDYGGFTILRADNAPGGLQVRNRCNQWVDVPGAQDAYIVNIGDAFMRWTNDRWISTLHRVVNPAVSSSQPTRRQSIAFFHNPNADAIIASLPGTTENSGAAKYPPIVYRDYAELRYRQAHGDDKTLALG